MQVASHILPECESRDARSQFFKCYSPSCYTEWLLCFIRNKEPGVVELSSEEYRRVCRLPTSSSSED